MKLKILALLALAGYVALSLQLAAAPREAPRPARLQTYDIVAPPACMKMLQERLPSLKSSIVQMDAFIDLKRRLAACGGSVVETSETR